MFYYAVLNEENVCIDINKRNQQLFSPPDNYLPIEEVEAENVLYRKYEDGEWSEEKYLPPEPTPQPTIEEQILAENQYQTALLEINMIGVL